MEQTKQTRSKTLTLSVREKKMVLAMGKAIREVKHAATQTNTKLVVATTKSS